MMSRITIWVLILFSLMGCHKSSGGDNPQPTPVPTSFGVTSSAVNGQTSAGTIDDINIRPSIIINFGQALNRNAVSSSVNLYQNGSTSVPSTINYSRGDSTLTISPNQALTNLTRYQVSVTKSLTSKAGGNINGDFNINFITSIDSSSKFPTVTDDELMTIVQKKTFDYFWTGAHPVSRLARERSSSGDIVTSGGSGFGIMAIVVGIQRGFITRAEGLARIQTMVAFLKKAQTFKGAFPHWLDGNTGKVIPFSQNDNGADLVETSYLMQGLLTARQYFSLSGTDESSLRSDITALYNAVEWDWFRKGSEQVLYWHWSPDKDWIMNVQIKGWNECLITYVLAASSPTHPIPRSVYENGWASNGNMRNNGNFFGVTLPLGPNYGGPLFFAHYSFLGLNPTGLTDQYANYFTQNQNHSRINYLYCVNNPMNNYGYSRSCWGLTASDIPNGYSASSPTNDLGVIAPTAAISSMPYTPQESMEALRFFYYTLGDKIFKQYGFVDAFSLKELWFADSFLAIDQGPIIIMLENYRTGLLWNLFMSCPEAKSGLKTLGFTSPNI